MDIHNLIFVFGQCRTARPKTRSFVILPNSSSPTSKQRDLKEEEAEYGGGTVTLDNNINQRITLRRMTRNKNLSFDADVSQDQ
jgi:hypothetical protein